MYMYMCSTACVCMCLCVCVCVGIYFDGSIVASHDDVVIGASHGANGQCVGLDVMYDAPVVSYQVQRAVKMS